MITSDSPSPTPTSEELVASVAALKSLIGKHAAQGDTDRRLADEVVSALGEAGAFRLGAPKRFGGHEAPIRTWLDVCSAVAEADGGAAWVTTLFNAGAYTVGLFPAQAQEEIFGADPEARVSGVLAPTGQSRKVPGGWRITGRWYYASGSWHATWAGVGIPITDASGETVDQGMALIPRGDLTVEDTWFTTGMRGSGSNCVVAEDVFVPEHRVMSVTQGLTGWNVDHHPGGALYRSNLGSVLALVLVGPQLGLARAALSLVREKSASKAIPYTFFGRQADSTAFQLQLAEAAMRIDTAHLHAYRAADDIDRAAERAEHLDMFVRARVRADVGYVAENVGRALDILMSAHGAASFAETNVLQRIWRDANTGARHGVVVGTVGYEALGQVLAGVDQTVTPLI
ncbi:acyl-CoA dehydrogenase family protein [Streptomyces sp. NPDC096040]|uniref:acyl-CoA dehydrogenase family protein n=1 Tax=Streptomyces sp. NPDC096040 TaxID=3155541 RepID=UPI003332D335